MLFVGTRFLLFKTVVKSKKQEFRQIVLKQQRNEVKQITVSRNDLYKDVNGVEWKEHNKEIVIKNVYHEVLSVERTTQGYLINIIEDKAENDLFAKFLNTDFSKSGLTDQILLVFTLNFVLPQQQHVQQLKNEEVKHLALQVQKDQKDFYSKTIKPPRA